METEKLAALLADGKKHDVTITVEESADLRDLFAMAALTGLCAIGNTIDTQNDEHRVSRAFFIADLCIKERQARSA